MTKRNITAIAIGFVIGILLAILVISTAYAAVSVTVCHRTGSQGNPYTRNVVSVHSVDDATGLNGHGDHPEDAWMSFEFEGVIYPGQNEDLFIGVIDSECNLIQPTSTPTNTLVPPTATDTATPTNTPTATYTLPPPPTATNTPDPLTPTATNTPEPVETLPWVITSTPTSQPTETPMPTKTPFITLTPQPTDTPYPPKPADADDDSAYPGAEMGILTINGVNYKLWLGTNAEDGSLLLPSSEKGAALYQKVVWIHRAWRSGWVTLDVGDTVVFTSVSGKVTDFEVVGKTYIDYGVYPNTETYGEVFQYLATCYNNEQGQWIGVELFKIEGR